ncbi:hypothetical protein [Streptomyces sp. RTd22]|uniref:hypothetical protein n=1 Tax=Streptomyces sp. RTd22 TaxID=1841249 RepID=UPI0007C586BD|nr:hypothetical protein [Streptomyces sp. RTd22]
MSALQNSVRAAKEARGEKVGHADVHVMRPARKTAGKKTTKKSAAKKTSGRKAPVKKTARKRSES